MGSAILDAGHLDNLIQALRARGFAVIAPVREEYAIVYDEIESAADLPAGWIDRQEKGYYRLHAAGDNRFFGHSVAANAWKKFLNPPRRRLWRAEERDGRLQFIADSDDAPPLAFLGVRSCELHAIRVQDAVFVDTEHRDDFYNHRRRQLFTIAVNCTRAGATCFCESMNTGPAVTLPADLVLTEMLEGDQHFFLMSAGSDAGREVAGQLPQRPASGDQEALARSRIDEARHQMAAGPRHFDSGDMKDLLYRNLESPAWDEVAERCLSCANCTLACPTCFCSAVEDTTDLTGDHAERWQRWDSCFSADFSYIHGGSVRQSTRSRYRQWMTHKLGTWIDQFGHSGCVGCGRCITWCPVGIDLTEQVRLIREAES